MQGAPHFLTEEDKDREEQDGNTKVSPGRTIRGCPT